MLAASAYQIERGTPYEVDVSSINFVLYLRFSKIFKLQYLQSRGREILGL